MNKTKLIFDDEAREKLLKGIHIMAKAVGSTLGPRGRNVAIAKTIPSGEIYERIILHDGVSVARAIDLKDEYENMGAQVIKQAAQKQCDFVGDGTSVVIVLSEAIISECFKMISTGINAMALRSELEAGLAKLLKKLKTLAIPLKTHTQRVQIATISAEDKELGELVTEVLEKVGEDGVVEVKESPLPVTQIEYQQGMQLDRGYMHQLFITNPERMEAVFENPQILVTDKSITSLVPLTNLLNSLTADSVRRPLVIISPDVSGEALPLLIQNKLEGKLYSLCIRAPSFGADQKNVLQDMAILTGAKYITEDAGHRFEDVTASDLGEAEFVSSTKDATKISGGAGSKEAIKKRIASIKKTIEEDPSEFDRNLKKTRLGKLTNGIALIRVGGSTEIEMKERRERIIDAVAALRSAMKNGITAGGEIVYLRIRELLSDKILGEKILKEVLKRPFKKLVENAGYDGGEMLSGLLWTQKEDKTIKNAGIDVTTGQVKDMIESGIVDPIEVSMEALTNATSVAIQLVTTGTIIIPEEKENHVSTMRR